MTYALSIDWLSFFCESDTGELNQFEDYYEYEVAPHGTRQYKQLITVYREGEEFAEVQQIPCSPILRARSMIVKICNRWLYSRGLWYRLSKFLELHRIKVLSVSRVDLCADFNTFYNGLHPITLIRKFLDASYRHIGRGIGASYFDHRGKKIDGVSIAHLNYTGLSFGSKKSDVRVYLYDKSFELATVKDKPHIRQLWTTAGLKNDTENHVWRLEISLFSGACSFKSKKTQRKHKITEEYLHSNKYISLIYFSFVKSLFSFIRNRQGIKNISREPRIQLFNGEPFIDRCVLNSDSGGDRAERILIKQLWQMSERYRGNEIVEDEGISKILASNLAANTGLSDWLTEKKNVWEKPKIK